MVLTTALAAIILIEYHSFSAANVLFKPIETGNDIPAVYKWSAEKKGDFAIIELPIGFPVVPEDARYMYFSTYHWKKLVSGYSGYDPAAYYIIREMARGFPDSESIGILEDLGVRYVILRGALYDAAEFETIKGRLLKDNEIKFITRFGDDYVYEIGAKQVTRVFPANKGRKEVPKSSWLAKASISVDRVKYAFDNNEDSASRWWTGRPQTSGDYLELDMGDVYNISKLSMAIGYVMDFPRGYEVKVSLNGANWKLVAEEGSVRFNIMSYVKSPSDANKFDIVFDSTPARFIRITQTGEHNIYWWSIAEIYVFEDKGH